MVYENISRLCKDKGLTIQQLEKLAGLGNGSIGKWKTFTPRAESLKAVANVLNVTMDYLMTQRNKSSE